MKQTKANTFIRLSGVRQNNLKNLHLELPKGKLLVFTGLSGSGKSSLAFDTLYAEGQRRYIETFTPYARQFFDRMDKPQADLIEGIPPAIAVEQRNAVRTTRSTVGTMTEICDYTKIVWPHLATLFCRKCQKPVLKEPPATIWRHITAQPSSISDEVLITFDLPLSDKLSIEETLTLIGRQGYRRLLFTDPAHPGTAPTHADPHPFEIVPLEQAAQFFTAKSITFLTLVQDRVRLAPENRARFVEACEQAYHLGKGKLSVVRLCHLQPANHGCGHATIQRFSSHLHCATCDIEYRDTVPALFSFNHPLGACPACHGFGRIIAIDYHLAMPDVSKSLEQGVVRPWRSGFSAECQDDLMRFCREKHIPIQVPFRDLPQDIQSWVIDGDPDYGIDKAHEWPHRWYGVKGYFKWLESKSYKMHVRVLLSRYRAYSTCPQCVGKRFQPETLLYRVPIPVKNLPDESISLADFYALPINQAVHFLHNLPRQQTKKLTDPIDLALQEIRSRLKFLVDAGLGYLTLDRPTRTLSGGETERVNLTTCLGTRLVNTLFVLDEPTVGLHPRDTKRLLTILLSLRDHGNTVAVVEHEPALMKAADQILDLGPGSGEKGGELVFQGTFPEILKSAKSITGQYLSGKRRIPLPARRPVTPPGGHVSWITVTHATKHNLCDLQVQIPLARFVCITGVSGSGKSTLLRDLVFPALHGRIQDAAETKSPEIPTAASDAETGEDIPNQQEVVDISGWESLGQIILVDQSSLGKTPRSNPAVYVGAFGDLRDLFAQTSLARQRGLSASAFSFNSAQGHCEHCRGAGFEKIEMQFLSDVFVRCPECNGRRYRPHILEVHLTLPSSAPAQANHASSGAASANRSLSIADLLEATIDECLGWLEAMPDSRPAQRALKGLRLLREVGLGYLRLGQPLNTLSGGECQRLKLAKHLVDFAQHADSRLKPALFLFDEPTTGLHFDDVRVLLQVFQRLVDSGHSVWVIEHNLEVIKCADWVIDLGPEAGDGGGKVVVQGTPEQVVHCPVSHTGAALLDVLAK